MTRLWDKGEPLDERVLRYTAGEDHRLDARLVPYDVRASIAHAEMLGEAGLLAGGRPRGHPATAWRRSRREHAAGEWRIELADEDVHTALESRLTERIGEAGARLHLGRSRNDQVLAALRLYLRDAVAALAAGAREVAAALDDLGAARGGDRRSPATPTSSRRCRARCRSGPAASRPSCATTPRGSPACSRRIEKNPLGSAAGYGVPLLPLDREATRAELGFAAVHEPVTAVQLSRGKAEAQVLFEIVLLMQDLGRLAADLVLFASSRVRLRQPARRDDHRLLDHAAEAQPRRLRAGARPRARRPRAASPRRSPSPPS